MSAEVQRPRKRPAVHAVNRLSVHGRVVDIETERGSAERRRHKHVDVFKRLGNRVVYRSSAAACRRKSRGIEFEPARIRERTSGVIGSSIVNRSTSESCLRFSYSPTYRDWRIHSIAS